MDPKSVLDLIARGETLEIEFKGDSRGSLSDRDLVEAVVCLANRPGPERAWLFLGVEDDGRITGARPRHEGGRTDPARLMALISSRTSPALTVEVSVTAVGGRDILAIGVPPSRVPVSTADGRYLRRAVGGDGRPICVPLRFHEMQALQADRGLLDYSALVVPEADWDDLDPLEFERLRRSVRERRGRSDESLLELSDLDLAKALGAVDANARVHGVRLLGLLLFGREEALRRLVPAHEVAIQVLGGHTVEVNAFHRWPLLRMMDEIDAYFRVRNTERELLVGMVRVGVPAYPPAAFREGVANALIHRDYTRLGAVHVQWYTDRIEIHSPGGLPEGVRLDNLLVTSPRPRNPLLSDAFKRAGLVERTARGVDTIFYEQLRNGRAVPSYARTGAEGVVLVLPGGDPDMAFVRLIAELGLSGRAPDLDGLLLLDALRRQERLTAVEAAARIQKSEGEAGAVLARLVVAGLAGSSGGTWSLSAEAARGLSVPRPDTPRRPADPAASEQVVLQYVARHGRITRRVTAQLCGIAPAAAGRILDRLVRSGRLQRKGSGGGAWYEAEGRR